MIDPTEPLFPAVHYRTLAGQARHAASERRAEAAQPDVTAEARAEAVAKAERYEELALHFDAQAARARSG